jgi:hypothetical protein
MRRATVSTMRQDPPNLSLALCHKILTSMCAKLVLRSQVGVWEGSAVAHAKGPKALAWRDMLWLLVTGAGVLLLVYAALSV